MRRIQAQPVEVKLVDPVPRVGGKKVAYRPGSRPVEVEGIAPLTPIAGGDVLLGELTQKIPGRSEVVVDDIQDHPDAQLVGPVHETAEIVGLAIEPGGSEQVHTVVPPPEFPGEVGDRHDLEKGHSDLRERRETGNGGGPGSIGRERPDVELIDDRAGSGPRPALV